MRNFRFPGFGLVLISWRPMGQPPEVYDMAIAADELAGISLSDRAISFATRR
jgi:hypothetical protein